MSNSLSVTADSIPPNKSKPIVLTVFPEFKLPGDKCSAKMQQQIDLLLLAIEAIDLTSVEIMLEVAAELELDSLLANRVALWRLRSTNPWRRSYRRDYLTLEEAQALAVIISYMAKRLNLTIRKLLLEEQKMRERNLPFDNNFILSEYLERFRNHFSSRMNSRRTKVSLYLASVEDLNELAVSLLKSLLFAGGTNGLQRIWVSLCDGEVV